MNSATRIEIDPEAYHAMPGISQSMIKLFNTDPGIYHDRYVLGTPRAETKRHFQWGHDFEDLVFYDRLPGVLIPNEVLSRSERDGKEILAKRGAAWTEWKAQMEAAQPGARLIKQDEWEKDVQPYLLARDQLREHGKAMKLLTGERHAALTWEDEETGLPCKCQLDVVSDWRVLTDLKTARDATPEAFGKAIYNFGYHLQAFWYRKAWERLTGELWPWTFVVVQSSPSYMVETYDLADSWYEMAEKQLKTGLRNLARAYETNQWHTPTFGQVTTLEPPTWALNQVKYMR
jgi:exodeoxyribonuclease VIII